MDVNTNFIEYLAEGVLILDGQRKIIAVNSALEKLLERPAGQLLGQYCFEAINCQASHNTACHAVCPLLNLQPDLRDEPLIFISNSGLLREVRASFTGLEAGHSMLILRDTSAQKRQEQLQAEFIATASHQLRTPLAGIKTSIGVLLENIAPDFQPLLRRLLENIQVSSLRLERVVNDLIELTSLLNGRVQFQPRRLEVQNLVEQAIKVSRPWLQTRNQSLKLELPAEPLFVEADSGRIVQVLGHLLSNASKFSPANSQIRLKVLAAEDGAHQGQVIFSVIDHGIGIAAEEREFIFEKFYQVQVVENSTETGSGLGLPLAKALVELNRGQIWFESKPGKGSTFNFSLPLAWNVLPTVPVQTHG